MKLKFGPDYPALTRGCSNVFLPFFSFFSFHFWDLTIDGQDQDPINFITS